MPESGFFCLLFLAVEEKYGRAAGMPFEKPQWIAVSVAHALSRSDALRAKRIINLGGRRPYLLDNKKPAEAGFLFFIAKATKVSKRSFERMVIRVDYIIPPIPPIPPMPPISGIAGLSSFGASAIIHSVVIIKLAIDAANCRAERVTLVGSRIPISIMSP